MLVDAIVRCSMCDSFTDQAKGAIELLELNHPGNQEAVTFWKQAVQRGNVDERVADVGEKREGEGPSASGGEETLRAAYRLSAHDEL